MAINKDEEIIEQRIIRSVSPPSAGVHLQNSASQQIDINVPIVDAKVYEDGSVRRLWTPGDPWDASTRFGTEQEE